MYYLPVPYFFFDFKISKGVSRKEAVASFTPEQSETYDGLEAETTRARREADKERARTSVHSTRQEVSGEVIETTHTKKGHDLFVVQPEERVDRDIYNEWNTTAKRMGGRYSSYRGNGAITGFQFTTRETADAFLKYMKGDSTDAKSGVSDRYDAFSDNKEQTAVERLTEMSDKLRNAGNESLNAERKTNTHRRAGQAASAEAAANKAVALANTMRNIANAIETGKAKFLNRIRTKSQVEQLNSFVNQAHYKELNEMYPSYQDYLNHRHDAPTKTIAKFIEYPQYTAMRSDLARMGRELSDLAGSKRLGERILKVANDVTAEYKKFVKKNLHQVSTFTKNNGELATFNSKITAVKAIKRSGFKGKAIVYSVKRNEHIIVMGPELARENGIWKGADDKRFTLSASIGEEILYKAKRRGTDSVFIPWQFDSVREQRTRLKAMGLETPSELRSAVREYLALSEAPKEIDKVKQLERSMVGRKKDGLDFFPTSPDVITDMLDVAEISEDMKVLEPSAGMGHVADAIRETGVEPDAVEMSGERRELLEAKGYNLIGRDFLDITEGGYDRIIMNPPFGNRRDAEHVEHAYNLLKDDGRVVAIMGEGVFFGQDKKAVAFREWLDSVEGTAEKLPEGSFNDPSLPVNTGVNARLVIIDKADAVGNDTSNSEIQYSTGNQPGTPIKKSDLESIPFVLKVTGREGNYRLHFKNDISVPLKTVELKGDDAFVFTPEGKKIPVRGSFKVGQGIEISQNGDIYTVTHENIHFFESIGLIDTKDKRLLNRAGEKMFGKTNDKKELRAKYVEAVSRNKDSDSGVDKIIQKVKEFISQLINVFHRTAGGVVRDIESGKIFDNEVQVDSTTEPQTQYSLADTATPQVSLLSELKDIPTGMMAVLKGIGKSHPSDKQDVSLAARAIGLLSHYSKNVPALNRVFNHALEKDDTKNRIENELTNDENYTKELKAFQKKNKAEYNGRYKDWIVESDINQKGYSVKKEEEGFIVLSPSKKKMKDVYTTEAEAWDQVKTLEGIDYINAGGSKAGADALRIFRTITDNMYSRLSKQMKDLEEYCEAENIPMPTVTRFENGKKVQIDLRLALAEMGDRRGYYFPRIRQNGNYVLYAEKNGANPVMTFHDLKSIADGKAGILKKKGYTNISVKKSKALSEDLFSMLGSTLATETAFNEALNRVDFSLDDIGIAGKFNQNRSAYILTGEFRKEYIDALESIGGEYRYVKTSDGAHGEWRFNNPAADIETQVSELLFQTNGTIPNIGAKFAEATAGQMADILRGRGSRSRMIGRTDVKGRDVVKGYEEDPTTALMLGVKGMAGGEAKADMALKMVKAISGQDVSWADFKTIKGFEGTYEDFEQSQIEAGSGIVEREAFEEIKEGEEKPLYSNYLAFKNNRRIDPAKQKNAWSEGMDLFKDMLRNEESVDRIIGTLKGAAVVKYLGFRVAAPVVNMTNMIAGVPAAMVGYGDIPINKALRDIGNSYRRYYKFSKGELSGTEQKVFEEIEKRGWDQAQFNQEALGAIQNNMQNFWGKTVDWSMKLFGWSEKLNRVATISATYKGLEKSKPDLTFEERLMLAKEISDKAHGIYTKANRPAMLRGGSAGAKIMQMAYVFKTFTHNYLATMVDLGVNQKDAKAVGWMLFAPAIFGTGSSIGATALIKRIGEAMDSDEPEEDFYKFCENYGAGNLARFGITGFGKHGVSLKGSLQIGLTDLPTSMSDLVGAPGSVLMDIFEGINETRKGNIGKGFEKMLPLAASSPFKAVREHSEGITTRSNTPVFYEDKPLKADSIDMWQRIFSFNPARIAGIREKMWAEKLLKKKYQESRSDIYQRLRRLYLSKNPSQTDHDDILEMIAIYNAVAKKKGQTLITRKSIKTTLKKMAR